MSNRYSKSPDLDLYVKGVPFHLHKENLAKKSAKVTRLLESNKINELRSILKDIDIDAKTFTVVARFCYGYKIQLSSENIVSILCLAYYLEMSDDHSSNNLLNKSVTFIEQRVLTNWEETVKSLCFCSDKILNKLADVGLVDVFLESLVEKALNDPKLLENLTTLSLPLGLYESLIVESSKHNVSVVESVCNYAKRWVFERVSGDERVTRQKREVIEAVERLLPQERGVISCGFLFDSFKQSILLNASSDCREGFEVRISKQLDIATSKDLLILSSQENGFYDIEFLRNILKRFYSNNYNLSDVSRFVNVAKMLEEFLFEVAASYDGLKVETFKALGEIAVAASCDVLRYSDGIYRAIDVYLEKHRDLIESEKMEVCRVLECSKLSIEACEHASKNEKLPLRIVVQVLFFSQKQIHEKVAREEKKTEEVDEDGEIENMNQSLLRLAISSDYSKKRELEDYECDDHCTKKKIEEKKISVWREVKRKFGCMTSSSTMDACNCTIKKRKKTYHRDK